MNDFRSSQWNIWFALLFYRLVIDLILILAVAPIFSNHFLFPISVDFKLSLYVFSILIYFAFCYFINGDKGNLNNLFNLTALIFYIAPMTALSGLNTSLSITPVLATFLAYCIINFITHIKGPGVVLRVKRSLSPNLFFGSLYIFLSIFIGWAFISGAFRYASLDLGASLYSARNSLGSLMDVGVMTYFNIWVTKVFAVTLFGVALMRKKYIESIFLVFFFLFAFSVTSHRTILFLPILTLMIYYFYSSGLSFARLITGLSLIALTVLAAVIFLELGALSAIIFRRALFVAPTSTYIWWDFFLINDFVLWSDRFLSGFISSQYNNEQIPFLLGDRVTEGRYDSVGLNSGLIATGFANFGWIGIVIYSFIFGLILRVTAFFKSPGIPVWFLAVLFLNPVRTIWTSTDIFTGLLTHGILIAILMLFFAPRNL